MQSREQLDQARFAGTGRADERYSRAGRNRQGQALEHRSPLRPVREADRLEADLALWGPQLDAIRRILFGCLAEQLGNALQTGRSVGQALSRTRDLIDRAEELVEQDIEGGQAARPELLAIA